MNAFGDVIGEDGAVLAGHARRRRQLPRHDAACSARRLIEPTGFRSGQPAENTTLVCLMTDAALTKPGCGIVSKMAHAGMARAVDPVHSAVDGDVVFTLASGAARRRSIR